MKITNSFPTMQLLSPKLTISEKISLAQASKILIRTGNDETGDALIYFVYRSKQTGRTHCYALGYTWQEAEYYLLDERNHQLRLLFEHMLYQHNLDKFTSLAEVCFQQGPPSERRLELLERFCERYDVPISVAFQIVQSVKPSPVTVQEKSLRAPVPFSAHIAAPAPRTIPTIHKSWFPASTWKGAAILIALLASLSGAFFAGKMSIQMPKWEALARIVKPAAIRTTVAHPKTKRVTATHRPVAAR